MESVERDHKRRLRHQDDARALATAVAGFLRYSKTAEGAPARNQTAMSVSRMKHPNEDVGRNGQIGFPKEWWTRSQPACMSQASPMNRYERSPRYAIAAATKAYGSSHTPSPPPLR